MDLRCDRARNCFCSALMLFVNMGVLSTAFSVFFPYIREIKGFSNTQVFLLTTMRQIFALIVMTQSDRYFRALDIKKGTIITFLTAAFAFGILAFAPDNRLYYLATSLFGVSYGLGGMIPASILLRRWYPENSGMPIGIAASGSGLAGMIIPVLAAGMVERYGLSAAFAAQGAAILLLILPLFFFVKDHPEEGELGEASGNREAEEKAERIPSPDGEDFRALDHPRLIAGMILMGLIAYQSAAGLSMLFRTSGYEMDKVALLLSAEGFFLIPSKILVGRFADNFGGRRMLRDCTLLFAATMFFFCLTAVLPFPVLFLLIPMYALGVSESTVGISIIAGDFASPGTYARVLKSCQFWYAMGGPLFSTTNGVAADLTGSYVPAYMLYGAASLIMLAVLLPGYPDRKH